MTANVWDKAYVFQSDNEFGKGFTATIKHRSSKTLQLMNDRLNIYSMSDTYKIMLSNRPEGEYKEKGSKLIGYGAHVANEEEVKLF